MFQECQIKDDDEIMEEENNKYNFRRFTSEEIAKKNSPFDRTKKKELTFLFQKKKAFMKDDTKISLEDIINKITILDISMNKINYVDISGNIIPYSPKTPPYPPEPSDFEIYKAENDIVLDG